MSQEIQPYGATTGSALVPFSTEVDDHAAEGLRKITRAGLIAIAVLVLGIGGLMAFLPMAGAVIATGEVSVETNVKSISHPFGGVAADILVSDGDVVKAGDLLIRLDDTVAGAAAEYSGLSLDQLLAKEARLRAVRDGAGAITFPPELIARADEPSVARIMADERRGFALGRQADRRSAPPVAGPHQPGTIRNCQLFQPPCRVWTAGSADRRGAGADARTV